MSRSPDCGEPRHLPELVARGRSQPDVNFRITLAHLRGAVQDWFPQVKSPTAAVRIFLNVLTTPVVGVGPVTAYDMLVQAPHAITVASAQPDLTETCRDIVIKGIVRHYKDKNGKERYQEHEDELGDPIKGARILWVVNNRFDESESITDDKGQVEKKFREQACNDKTGKLLEVLKFTNSPGGGWLMESLALPNKITTNHNSYIEEKRDFNWMNLLLWGGASGVALYFAFGLGLYIGARDESKSKKETPNGIGPKEEDKEDFRSQLEELQSQLRNTTQDNITLRTRAQELEHQVKDLQNLRETAEGLTVKVDGLTQENVNLRSSNNALVEQGRRLHDEVDKLNAVSFKVHEDNSLLSAQVEELRLKFNELRLQLTGVIQENVTLRSDRDTLGSQARKLQDDVDRLNKELERIKAEKAKNKQVNPKNPEWVTSQREFEKRWQAAKSNLLPIQSGETGNEPEHILGRFKVAIGIIQGVSLGSAIGISTIAMRIRAGIEYLIPQIWPNNRVLKRFFDPSFNAGYLDAESLARIVYLPENYRNLSSFTNDQKKDIRRIRRVFMYALHPDTAKVDTDKNLQESVDDLLKIFNPAWSYIENLIN